MWYTVHCSKYIRHTAFGPCFVYTYKDVRRSALLKSRETPSYSTWGRYYIHTHTNSPSKLERHNPSFSTVLLNSKWLSTLLETVPNSTSVHRFAYHIEHHSNQFVSAQYEYFYNPYLAAHMLTNLIAGTRSHCIPNTSLAVDHRKRKTTLSTNWNTNQTHIIYVLLQIPIIHILIFKPTLR